MEKALHKVTKDLKTQERGKKLCKNVHKEVKRKYTKR